MVSVETVDPIQKEWEKMERNSNSLSAYEAISEQAMRLTENKKRNLYYIHTYHCADHSLCIHSLHKFLFQSSVHCLFCNFLVVFQCGDFSLKKGRCFKSSKKADGMVAFMKRYFFLTLFKQCSIRYFQTHNPNLLDFSCFHDTFKQEYNMCAYMYHAKKIKCHSMENKYLDYIIFLRMKYIFFVSSYNCKFSMLGAESIEWWRSRGKDVLPEVSAQPCIPFHRARLL